MGTDENKNKICSNLVRQKKNRKKKKREKYSEL